MELLSFTKHLHADTHQERYHTWKKQQRSKDWEALNQMRLPCPAEVSGRTSSRNRPNTRHKRKNWNGNDVSFRTHQHSQREARGGHNYRKNRGNRNLRHFQKDVNSFQFKAFPVDGSEMGHERDFGMMNDSIGSVDRFGRNLSSGSFRSESPLFGHQQYSNFNPQDDTTSIPGQTNQSDSSWSSRLRRARHQSSQAASEPKTLDESFPKVSLRRKNRFSNSPDSSIFFGAVGDNESNRNNCPKSASPVMGVPSRTFLSDNMTSRSGRSQNQQFNDSNIYSEFVPEKKRNSFGNRQNRTRYFKNRTWVSDDLKSRVGESQDGSRYTQRKFVSSDALSLENSDVTRETENPRGVTTRSGTYQLQSDSFESFSPASFKDNQPVKKDSENRDSGMNTQEEPRDVGRSFSHPIDGKNAEQRAYFTFGFPDAATGSPEESKTEVIEKKQIPPSGVGSGENKPSSRTRRIRDSDDQKDESLDRFLKFFTDSKAELPSDEFGVQSKGIDSTKSKPSKSCVTETSSLRRTSPRLRCINVTQSQNSDLSSVEGSSGITNTIINVEQKQPTLGNNSMPDEEVERLNALINMKREPSDSSEVKQPLLFIK